MFELMFSEGEGEPSASESVAIAGAGMLKCRGLLFQFNGLAEYGRMLDMWSVELDKSMKDVRKNAKYSV
jgi:hypothetical protein